jgi:hypothetical protein
MKKQEINSSRKLNNYLINWKCGKNSLFVDALKLCNFFEDFDRCGIQVVLFRFSENIWKFSLERFMVLEENPPNS